MSDVPVAQPKLPTFGMQDGDQIIDSNGNIYEYNAEKNCWIYRGQVELPDIVSVHQDGLIYPEIYRKLQLIQELIDRGIDFNVFKLNTPGTIPYYYLFYSSDDTIRFYPESRTSLRLELDRNRLYQKFLRTCCAGPKGATGDRGATGRAGLPADNERFQSPTNVTTTSLNFDTTVATPIDTEISLRLFRGETDTILVEYLVDISSATGRIIVGGPDGNLTADQLEAADLLREARGAYKTGDVDGAITKLNEIIDLDVQPEATQAIIDSINAGDGFPDSAMPLTIIIYDDDIDVSITDTFIEFDVDTGNLKGTLSFTSGTSDISTWKYKARQRGPKGTSGSDGSPFLEVINQTLDDPLIKSSTAVISARRSGLTNNIFYVTKDLTEEICVSNLGIGAGALPVGDLLEARYAAVKVTTRRCKDVGLFKYSAPEYEAPELDLPAWDPTPDCVSAARYNQYLYEWWDHTDPKYPWRIFRPPRPNEQCCQEDMFWCPNVGDNPCGVNHWKCGGIEKLPSGAADAQGLSCDGSAKEPVLKAPQPLQPECDCDCRSPIAYELQNGGYTLPAMILGSSDTQSVAEFSVIDGRTDTYKINVKSNTFFKINVALSWKPEICGGEIKEKENCQYQDDCEAHTTVIVEDNNSNAAISGGGMTELSEIPSSTSFIINPLYGTDLDVLLNVMVNDTRSQCCRGYEIRVTATTDVPPEDVSIPL
jgi:hypothetical protein